MPKLCVIGSSHAGAIKLGWEALPEPDRSGWSADFFVAVAQRGRSLAIAGSHLVTDDEELRADFRRTSGHSEHIEPDLYQAFFIIGFDLSPTSMDKLAKRMRTWMFVEPGRSVVSQRCFEAAIEGIVRATTAVEIARMVRSLSPAPIIVMPAPQPSAEIETSAEEDEGWLKKPAMAEALFAATRRGLASLERSEGFLALNQPAETLVPGQAYTRPDFARDAVNGLGKIRPADMFHMDAKYGELVARDLAQACAAGDGTTEREPQSLTA